MKLYLLAAAGAAILCAAPFTSVEARVGQAVEVQQEEGFLEQASNYVFEADNSGVLVVKKDKNKDNSKDNTKEKTKNKTKNKTKKTPNPAPKQTKKPTKKAKRTPKPTKKEKKKRTPKPTRRTRKPTRQPTVSKKYANRLLDREWTEDECVGRRSRRSKRCRDLNEGVCSLRLRRAESRFGNKAAEVCEFVGMPITRSEEFDNMYTNLVEDEDYEEAEFIGESEDEEEDYEETETFADFE